MALGGETIISDTAKSIWCTDVASEARYCAMLGILSCTVDEKKTHQIEAMRGAISLHPLPIQQQSNRGATTMTILSDNTEQNDVDVCRVLRSCVPSVGEGSFGFRVNLGKLRHYNWMFL